MPAYPHPVDGDAPAGVGVVFLSSIAMVAAAGLGGLPFFLVPKGPSKRTAGLATALAAGVMLSASYTMIYEAQDGHTGMVAGLFLGALFVRKSRAWLSAREAARGETKPGLLLFLATMALHSVSEGAGVGVAFARNELEASGVRRGALIALAIGAHNIPEGFGVALALVARGATPSKATWWAALTSAPQILGAVPAFLCCESYAPLHPLTLGFAAGCMVSVVVGEMLPDALEQADADGVAFCCVSSAAAFEGFRVTLDWAAHDPASAARVLAALGWSVAAGGATSLGGAVVTCLPRRAPRWVDAGALGFAAGVMLALALLDIALPAWATNGAAAGGPYVALLSFFGGAAAVSLLRQALHGMDDATLLLSDADDVEAPASPAKLGDVARARTAWLVSLALAAHNAPEGLAVGVAASHEDTGRAALMAFAIGAHNIPEGLAVASSIFAATRSRSRAFVVASATGMVEPLAAGLSAAVLAPYLSSTLLEAALLGVAGVMTSVAAGELAPTAWASGPKPALAGGLAGWCVLRVGLSAVAAAHAGDGVVVG